MTDLQQIPLTTITGDATTLADYRGKVLLVVNVASKCGLTPQYEALEQVYRTYHDQGFEVLGFPANNFLGQEPGTDAEIAEFCQLNFAVSFPMFSKISVAGDDQHPLYAALTAAAPHALGDPEGQLPWSWAEELLVANRNYWVVTVSSSGRPSAMPVWGVWLPGPERFRFSCAPTARKLRNIVANPQCAVMVDDTVECVSVEGRARVVDSDVEVEAVAEMLAAFLPKYWPDPAEHAAAAAFLRENTLVEVTPDRAFGIIEREDDFARCATRWRW